MMQRRRLAVLGNPESWYASDLRRAAGEIPIDFLTFEDIFGGMTRDTIVVGSRRAVADADPVKLTANPVEFGAVLVRTMPIGSLEQVIFRMNTLHSLERMGYRIINPARCLEVAIDKWLALELAQRLDLDVPRTFCCQTRRDALEAFEELGRDCVVKPIFGGEGRGIMRVDSQEMAWRVFGTLEKLQAVIYLQEFLPHSGFDIRILVLKDDIFSVQRWNDDWRTNVSRGGIAKPYSPSPEQEEIAHRIVNAIQGIAIGVDILPTKDGRNMLLEVNAVPGWKGTSAALGVDIAKQLIHIAIDD